MTDKKTETNEKREYAEPTLDKQGDLKEITEGNAPVSV